MYMIRHDDIFIDSDIWIFIGDHIYRIIRNLTKIRQYHMRAAGCRPYIIIAVDLRRGARVCAPPQFSQIGAVCL